MMEEVISNYAVIVEYLCVTLTHCGVAVLGVLTVSGYLSQVPK